ncbi:stressosome-associated protein Prli42 [Virgibacillus sp. NKC19-16]|nr:stressosome-associated protein Prli42 [Virgibacillus sp. NKC19-16]UJL44787.1 stressosome-associated protein Prli42 [Virgibacillus sp. NKC19-16]
MATKQRNQQTKRKPSKRERRAKVLIYIMILAMLLSSLTAGLAMFI